MQKAKTWDFNSYGNHRGNAQNIFGEKARVNDVFSTSYVKKVKLSLVLN
jgi:hypothetical protein